MEYFNFILYLAATVFVFKQKYSIFVKCIALLWTFCSFIGIFYYHSEAYKIGLQPISIFPFVFLFLCWLINIIPLRKNKKLSIDCQGIFHNNPLVRIILVVISISAIPLFLELLFVFVTSIFNGKIFLMAENYDDLANGYSDRLFTLSKVSDICLHISFYFQILSPLLLLLYLNYKDRKKIIVFGLLASSLVIPLYSVCSGSRTAIVFFFLYSLLLYLFLYKSFRDDINKKLKRIFIFAGSLVCIILILLSVGRFVLGGNYDDDEAGNSLYIYTSESMYNFNTMASQTERNTDGSFAFMPTLIRLDLAPVKDLSQRRNYLNRNMDISRIWFYTYVGDFCVDFGYVGALFIVLLLFFLIVNILKKHIALPGLCLIAIYIYIIGNGIFYYPFQAGDSPLIGCLVFAIVFKLISRSNRKQIVN